MFVIAITYSQISDAIFYLYVSKFKLIVFNGMNGIAMDILDAVAAATT